MDGYTQVPNYPNYSLNPNGDLIRKYKNGKIKHLKFFLIDNGYYRINLCKNGIVKAFYKHRLLAKTFLENPENKKCVDHRDRCKTNNCLTNLKWATHTENNRNKSITKRNNTGHRAIRFILIRKNKPYYTATYTTKEGKNVKKYFSVDTLGKELALQMAIDTRKEAEDLHYYY